MGQARQVTSPFLIFFVCLISQSKIDLIALFSAFLQFKGPLVSPVETFDLTNKRKTVAKEAFYLILPGTSHWFWPKQLCSTWRSGCSDVSAPASNRTRLPPSQPARHPDFLSISSTSHELLAEVTTVAPKAITMLKWTEVLGSIPASGRRFAILRNT